MLENANSGFTNQVGEVVNPNSSAQAYVDPYFSLSPAEIAAGYSLEFSNSIGNSPVAAPGPTPGAGLLGLGFAARRKAALSQDPLH